MFIYEQDSIIDFLFRYGFYDPYQETKHLPEDKILGVKCPAMITIQKKKYKDQIIHAVLSRAWLNALKNEKIFCSQRKSNDPNETPLKRLSKQNRGIKGRNKMTLILFNQTKKKK